MIIRITAFLLLSLAATACCRQQIKELFRLSCTTNTFLLIDDPKASGQHVAGWQQAAMLQGMAKSSVIVNVLAIVG
jgi:hypothetical protein